jgi:RNA polymerase sigma-70 factor (ECF subfamily)
MHATPLPIPEESDLQLAERVAGGDLDAFASIMRRHNRMLYRVARSVLRDNGEAEDCVQSAYLLAYQAIGTFAGHAKLGTWLVRIVINEALGRKRRAASRDVVTPFDLAQRSGAEGWASSADGPESEAIRHELVALIERRVDELPEAYRMVFVLRALEELSVEETAALLAIPEATVRSRYFRARGILREALARELDVAIESAFPFAGARCDRIVAAVCRRLGAGSPEAT